MQAGPIGGLTPACTARALDVFSPALDHVVPVSTPEVAEMTKLLENIFRSVNIALMNELAMLCDRMRIDVWEVIDAVNQSHYDSAELDDSAERLAAICHDVAQSAANSRVHPGG